MKKYTFFILLLLIIPGILQAQRWKKTRYELIGALGTSNFMGDLGGGAEEAAHSFGVRDLDINTTRPVIQAAFRYKVAEPVALKLSGLYALISADDANSAHLGRQARNLQFRSNLWQLSAQLEYSIIKEPIGSRYKRQRFRGLRKFGVNVYLFAGAGVIYFNPKAQASNGQWYELQKLSTEGQGILDTINPTPDPYKLIAGTFPMGIGFKYNIQKRWAIGLEIGNHYTTTDFIDDTSTSYYDNYKIQAYVTEKYNDSQLGAIAAELADRTINLETGADEIPFASGSSWRGDETYNDAYVFLMVSLVYKMRTTRKGGPKF